MKNNRINQLFQIEYPIIQAGMIWCSGWELASAVSNAGGLGLIGSGSMYPEILREHILKCKQATNKPFGVNVPLLYPDIDKHIETIIDLKVPIVFTSAGNPVIWTQKLKNEGIVVVHVIANSKFAQKAVDAGVDALVAEGFEAGGHNGKEETTTLCLVPAIVDLVSVPVIAAGGIGDGRAMLATMALGAEGVQVGTRFLLSEESSAHPNFKQRILQTPEGGTELSLKKLTPVRLIKNKFWDEIKHAEMNGAKPEELAKLLGHGRAKRGMFEGNLNDGELEVGQVGSNLKSILPAGEIVNQMMAEFVAAKLKLTQL